MIDPRYLDGMRAFDRGEPYDPRQLGQWRYGWEQAQSNATDYGKAWCYAVLSESTDPEERAAAESILNATDEVIAAVFRDRRA